MGKNDDKTEDATPKKLKDARKKGQIAKSPELAMWSQILVASMILRHTITHGQETLRTLLTRLSEGIADPGEAAAMGVLGEGLWAAVLLMAPLAAGMFVVAIVGDLAQTRGVVAPSLLKPKAERISPMKGAKRLVSPQGVWQAAKVLIKSAVLVAVAWGPLSTMTEGLVASSRPPLSDILGAVGSTAMTLARNVAVAGIVLAAADYAFQRRRLTKELKMTKQEVKDEYRQQEGDAQVKSQIRSKQIAMSRNRMMAGVADASVVVVNPTHVAVALKYDPASGAPRVVAKGMNEVATRIRAEAEKAGVPMVRDVPMARSIHAACDIGEEIPAEMYEAVARLLAFVFSLDRRTAAARGVIPSPVAALAS